jgi:hypothetical protein
MLSAGHKAIAIPSATLLKQKDIEILTSTLNVHHSSFLATPHSQRENVQCSSFLATPHSQRENVQCSTFNVHMFPDRDAPGERLFMQLKEILPQLVHHQLPPDCKDFSEYYLSKKPA